MTHGHIHVLHCYNTNGAACAVAVRINHEIQAGEVTDQEISEVTEPQIISSHLVADFTAITVDFVVLVDVAGLSRCP